MASTASFFSTFTNSTDYDLDSETQTFIPQQLSSAPTQMKMMTSQNPTTVWLLLTMKISITVISIIANLIGLAVLVYGRMYRQNMYMITLLITCVDLLTSTFHLPIAIIVAETGLKVSESTLCFINALNTSFFTDVALLGQMLFNIDRYIAIRWPYIYLAKVTKFRLIIGWGVPAVVLLLVKFLRMLLQSDLIIYLPIYQICIDWVESHRPYNSRFR